MIPATRSTVLFSGICALVLSMGLARYSFTPMIPGMQAQLGLSESLAGWLAGWSYVGYLAGLFIVWLISDLRAKDFFYRYGLVVAVLATFMMAAHDHRLVWYVSRFFAGVATAAGFTTGLRSPALSSSVFTLSMNPWRAMSTATAMALAKPSASVPPWLFTAMPLSPRNMAPL